MKRSTKAYCSPASLLDVLTFAAYVRRNKHTVKSIPYICFLVLERVQRKTPPSKLFKGRVSLLLQPHAYRFNMQANPKLDRPAMPSYGCSAIIGQ